MSAIDEIARSETVELGRALALLDDLRKFLAAGNSMMAESTISRVEIIVERMAKQAGRGVHKNPPIRVHASRGTRGLSVIRVENRGAISLEAHAILYRHIEDGKQYRHDFVNATTLLAVERAGKKEVLITSPDGFPIWQDF